MIFSQLVLIAKNEGLYKELKINEIPYDNKPGP